MPDAGALPDVVSALWARIARRHSKLPPRARVALSSQKLSPRHGWDRWSDDGGVLVGLAVSAELLSAGTAAVATHVYHEAAHVLCWRRQIVETSSRGVYHNALYLAAAEAVGMRWPADTPSIQGKGWAVPELGTTARADVGDMLDELDHAISTASAVLVDPAASRTRDRTDRLTVECTCDPPRRFRISATVLELGPIVCKVCGGGFSEPA